MNRFLHGVARAVAETFSLPGPVVEIGAFQVPGQEHVADLRPLFPRHAYIGLDRRPGPGVDLVGDVEQLPLATASVGTVVAMSTFEHVPRFWRGLDEVRRVLRPDGALLIACPFHFHIHAHPDDYWRFTPSALRLLLDRYPSKLIGWHGPRTRPANVWALALRERHRPIDDRQHRLYRLAMTRHAREPLPLARRLRYTLGRLLCGSRPFVPWLQRERWDSVVENSEHQEQTCHLSTRTRHPARGRAAPTGGGDRPSASASSTGTAESCSATACAP
jgi:SAM-dependent methyltransferase